MIVLDQKGILEKIVGVLTVIIGIAGSVFCYYNPPQLVIGQVGLGLFWIVWLAGGFAVLFSSNEKILIDLTKRRLVFRCRLMTTTIDLPSDLSDIGIARWSTEGGDFFVPVIHVSKYGYIAFGYAKKSEAEVRTWLKEKASALNFPSWNSSTVKTLPDIINPFPLPWS